MSRYRIVDRPTGPLQSTPDWITINQNQANRTINFLFDNDATQHNDLPLEEARNGDDADATCQSAFPTEGRERQKIKEKARKEAGIAAPKRKFDIEDHVDDCGTDLSGLGEDIALLAADLIVERLAEHDDDQDDPAHPLVDGLAIWWLWGSEADHRTSNLSLLH